MLLVLGFVVAVQDLLHALKQCGADDGWMCAFVLFAVPSEEAKIKRVAENAIVNMALAMALPVSVRMIWRK